MLNGITYGIVEDDQTLKDFAFACARTFIWQCRDYSGPLPEKFEADKWHSSELKRAQGTVKRLKKLTRAQQLTFGERVKKNVIKSTNQAIAGDKRANARIEKMKTEVKAWDVLETLSVLKHYMLQQLDLSIDTSTFAKDNLLRYTRTSPISFYRNALKDAKAGVKYHSEGIERESTALDHTNEFLKALHAAL